MKETTVRRIRMNVTVTPACMGLHVLMRKEGTPAYVPWDMRVRKYIPLNKI